MTIADEIRAKAYTAERMTVEQVCYNEGIEDAARIAEAGEAKLREELEAARKSYYDVADAVARDSTSVEDLCRQARETRQERDHMREELDSLRAKLARAREVIEPLVETADQYRNSWGELEAARAFLKETEARAAVEAQPACDQRAYRGRDGIIRFYPSAALLWDDGEWAMATVQEDECQAAGHTRLPDAEAAAIWATRPKGEPANG